MDFYGACYHSPSDVSGAVSAPPLPPFVVTFDELVIRVWSRRIRLPASFLGLTLFWCFLWFFLNLFLPFVTLMNSEYAVV